jgi:hypothetical protein
MIDTGRGDPLMRDAERPESMSRDDAGIEGFAGQPYEDRSRIDRPAPLEPMSVTGLVRRLIEDVATLFRKELAMATSEVLQSVDEAKAGTIGMVGGGAMLYAGLLFLMLAGTLALTLVLPGWAAALIVGGSAALIGLIMVQASKRKLRARSFAPKRAADELRKDREMIGRQMHEHDRHARQ